MVIPVINHQDDPASYAGSVCYACGSNKEHHSDKENQHCKTSAVKQTTFEPITTTDPSFHESKTETLNAPTGSSAQFTKLTKDLVGNCKEFRIEHNKCDLRIIGNGNRIRIGCNVGNLQIIGNSTRLKISNNSGRIRYTGNDGRICLGSDSRQQAVDYIGSNGILKVVNAEQLSGVEHQGANDKSAKKCGADDKTAAAATHSSKTSTVQSTTTTQCHPKKVKVKSASYGGDCSMQWQKFNEMFQRHGWQRCVNASLPNLGAHCQSCERRKSANASKHCKIDNSINVVNSYGNIVIKNAVNVSI